MKDVYRQSSCRQAQPGYRMAQPACQANQAVYARSQQTDCMQNRQVDCVRPQVERMNMQPDCMRNQVERMHTQPDCSCAQTNRMNMQSDCMCNQMDRMNTQADCVGSRSNQPEFALAMAYVMMQPWEQLYDLKTGLSRGTIFPSLDKPFLGKRCCRRG